MTKAADRSGDANAITRNYFDRILLELRHIGAVQPDTSFQLYGQKFRTPIMMAALSHLNSCHPDGLVEMARGAKLAGAVNWAGMGEVDELRRILAVGVPTIRIIKPYAERRLIEERIRVAEEGGALAVGMDVDHQFTGRGTPDVIHDLVMAPQSLEDLAYWCRFTELPFVVKGVLSVRDAVLALEAGARGIVVSHHHGIVDYALPPMMILPDIAAAIGGRIPIFVDCGINSGMDAFKALALGATAVSAGRIVMGPLAEKGAEGVRELVDTMTAELAGVMARTAAGSLAEIDPAVLHIQ
ncbi:MAG: alpha-hydroxy acid oxidase [Bacillota bacterium]|nr:alpha-hydroxy acid oxidase [Bacillota bacterium]